MVEEGLKFCLMGLFFVCSFWGVLRVGWLGIFCLLGFFLLLLFLGGFFVP